jgi:uncharacterized membrane protein (UPF0127 family)
MKLLKDGLLFLLGAIFLLGCIYLFLQEPAPAKYQQNPILKVGNTNLILEIADTEAERTQGLSGRDSLVVNHGMLFVFDEPGNYGFWMKDMRFPIDIIFLDVNLRVINVYEGVKPDSFPTPFYPVAPAKYVLEINSGEASRLGIDTNFQMILDR